MIQQGLVLKKPFQLGPPDLRCVANPIFYFPINLQRPRGSSTAVAFHDRGDGLTNDESRDWILGQAYRWLDRAKSASEKLKQKIPASLESENSLNTTLSRASGAV